MVGLHTVMALNDNYETDHFDASTLNNRILAVHICGYINPGNQGDEIGGIPIPPTNHWAAFLVENATASTRLDMAPGYGTHGLRGKIELTTKEYDSSYNLQKTLEFPVKDGTTVSSILTLINTKGRDRYNFSEEGEGCRYWMYLFVSDLEGNGIVPPGSAQETWSAVSYYWRDPSGQELREVKKGTFR